MRGRDGVGAVAGIAVAVGVGAAVCTGWGAGTAWADDTSAGSDTSTASDTTTVSSPADNRGDDRGDDRETEPDPDRTDVEDDAPESEDDAPEDAEDEDDALEDEDDALEDEDAALEDDALEDEDASGDDAPSADTDEPASRGRDTVVVADAEPAAATQTALTEPDAAPAAAPQLWTLMGAARPEDTAPSQHQPADTHTTSEMLDVAPGDSIAYTADPTFFDQLTVAGLRVVRGFSRLIGVDLYGVIAKALASDRPPSFLLSGLDARRTEYEVSDGNLWQVWEFHPYNPTGKTVVAVHGGGFVVRPLLTHWIDYTNMARDTGATVIVPLYPLATSEAGAARNIVPAMAQFISHQIALHGAEDVSVYADSAGSILAMSAVRELVLAGGAVPASMVLLSPAPDVSLSNPDIRQIDDPVIDVDNLDFYQNYWSAGLAATDPMVSPLFIEGNVLAGFPPTTIYIGSLEVGLPDTLLLQQKWNAAGGAVSLVVGRGQIHDWALGGLPLNSQAPKVRPDIYRQLGLNSVAAGPATITTRPPSFGDQLVVWGLRTLRWFSETTGIKLFTPIVGQVTSTDPPPSTITGLIVTEHTYNGWPVWELASPRPSGEYVVALHGGGFESEANIIHWSDYAEMARDTGATVLVPIYPLAPPKDTGTATTLVPPMADYLSMLIDEHGVDNVSLYGDSAGGSFAMLAVQEMLRRCRSDVQCVVSEATPSRMVLVSPALHLTLRGPEVDAIDDPILPSRPAGEGPQFNGELDMDDPRVNPISGADLTGLPPTVVYIGTLEKLYPGALAFRDKLLTQDAGADFTVIIGDGQMHGWALGGLYINSQAPLWRSNVYRQLGLLDSRVV